MIREHRAARWILARREQGTAGWRPTDALARGMVCGLGLVAAGLIMHQPALLLIGAPLLISAAVGVASTGAPAVTAQPRSRWAEQGRSELLTVSIDPGRNSELVAIRMPRPGATGIGAVHLLPASATTVRTRVRWDAWGEGLELRPDHLVAGPDGLLAFGPVVGQETRRLVLPPVSLVPTGPLPPRAAGLVGVHRSRRPGDGTELRDIRPFQAGDRLRRVDWRVSLRAAASVGGRLVPGTLHVRERHAETDAELILALDTRTDLTADMDQWAGHGRDPEAAGSLDTGVRAATALAASYLRQGDRVGVVDLGSPRLGIPPGSGRRQLERIRHQLVTSGRRAGWSPRPVLRAAQVPPGALVVVFSTFLDDAVTDLAVHTARRGNTVIAVDLLPDPLTPPRDTPWGESVLRILRAEHAIRCAALRSHGIPVVPWADGTPFAPMLRRLRHRGALAR
jgi:uncharacterized protein (DUF58 family)